MPQTQVFPTQASTMAPQVDALYFFLLALAAFFTLLISGLVVYFAIKYRRRSADETGEAIHGNLKLEITWTVIPLLIVLFIFGWSAKLFFTMARPPAETLDVYVVGKQWMWKFQHPDGHTEVNELHVPVGTSVRLTMTSQDVIHDVYIPDFRVKADVLPGRYTHLWFKATKPGRYQKWLAGGAGTGTMSQAGEKLFKDLSCITCHREDTTGRGPTLIGLYGKAVTLDNGNTVEADEAYLRESIVNPRAKMVSGFQPIMPTFQGLVSEEGLLQLLEYIKSLKAVPSNATGAPAAPAAPATPEKK
jgi:cytochrome c oxidase subunit 2